MGDRGKGVKGNGRWGRGPGRKEGQKRAEKDRKDPRFALEFNRFLYFSTLGIVLYSIFIFIS